MNRSLRSAAKIPLLKDLAVGIAKEFAALRREIKALKRRSR